MNKQLSLIRANANTDTWSLKNLTNILSAASCIVPIASELATTLKSNSTFASRRNGQIVRPPVM